MAFPGAPQRFIDTAGLQSRQKLRLRVSFLVIDFVDKHESKVTQLREHTIA